MTRLCDKTFKPLQTYVPKPILKYNGKYCSVQAFTPDNGITYTRLRISKICDGNELDIYFDSKEAVIEAPEWSYVYDIWVDGSGFSIDFKGEYPEEISTAVNDYINLNFTIVEDGE